MMRWRLEVAGLCLLVLIWASISEARLAWTNIQTSVTRGRRMLFALETILVKVIA